MRLLHLALHEVNNKRATNTVLCNKRRFITTKYLPRYLKILREIIHLAKQLPRSYAFIAKAITDHHDLNVARYGMIYVPNASHKSKTFILII